MPRIYFCSFSNMKKTLFYLVALLPFIAAASDLEGERLLPFRVLCAERFRDVFHDLHTGPRSVTSQRKESRVTVHLDDADSFFTEVLTIMDDYRQTDPTKLRVMRRDVPDSHALIFITDTDYVRNIIGVDANGKEVHRARIRKRKYAVVSKDLTVEEYSRIPSDKIVYSRIADGDGIYAKWEFKVGSPEKDLASGDWSDREGVVDKLGPVLLDSDIDLLQNSPDSFRMNWEAVAERAKQVTLTRNGIPTLVNSADEVDKMIRTQGWLHEQGWSLGEMEPQVRMRYVRNAYRVEFPHPYMPDEKFEIQITFDLDIVQTYLKSGNIDRSFPIDRVIELKIPVQYAELSDERLEDIGLGQLAAIRKRYGCLKPLEETQRGSGKRSNLLRRAARILP
jgi:hypothetical protein